MSSPRPTDARLARALATHVPAAAPDGLRARIFTKVETTPQRRPVPSVLAALFDADSMARRRNLLVAAVLLLALTLATAAVIGTWLELRRPPLRIEPPDDLAGYVESAYLGLADLPAFEMVGLETGDRHVIHSDGSGAIRDERPSTNVTKIASDVHSVLLSVDPEGRRTMIDLGRTNSVPGGAVGAYMGLGRCPEPPSYIGVGTVLDRPTYRIRCGIAEYWFDVETRLVLRSAVTYPSSPETTTPAGPTAAPGTTWEVTELHLGPQPADLFSMEPPDGFTVVRADDPACPLVWFAECTEAQANPGSPRPYVTPPPAADGPPPPADLAAFAADVTAAYAKVPALDLVIEDSSHVVGDAVLEPSSYRSRHFADGNGRFRTELGDTNTTIYISTGGHIWISYHQDDGSILWLDDAGPYADHGGVGDIMLGFEQRCEAGWQSKGVDLVMDRPAVHLVCGTEHYWVDREWLLVVRSETLPTDPLERVISTAEVVDLHLGPQRPDLFELPEGAIVSPRP